MNNAERISDWINSRKKENQSPMPCIFQICIPKSVSGKELEEDENIKILTDIFDKYDINWGIVDTIGGAYNLNRDWIETGDIPCYIEYCGVYPVEWDIEDIVILEDLEYEGKVIIKVMWHTEKGFIPNN
jgi:hypothetical protein